MFSFAVRARHSSSENVGSPTAMSSPMFSFVRRRQASCGAIAFDSLAESPKVDVGEIDTRAPFESVRAAVSLFRDAVSPRSRPAVAKKPTTEERVLEKETQHNMVLVELDYHKNRLHSAEKAKARAFQDLEKANKTVRQLTDKIGTLTELKQAAIRETEATKIRVGELEEQKSVRAQLGNDAWKVDLDSERERYKASSGELNSCKQEMNSLRQEFNVALAAKFSAFQEEEEAEQKMKMNQERRSQLLKEVTGLREALDQAKLTALQTEEEYLRLEAEKEVLFVNYNAAELGAKMQIEHLRRQYEPEERIAHKLEETTVGITVLHEQVNDVRASDFLSLKNIVSELNNAKQRLQEVAMEENEIRNSIASLKLQLEEVKRDHLELETKALEAESTVEQMQAESVRMKNELEEAISSCKYDEMQASLNNLLAEVEKDRNIATETNQKAMLLKQEAEAAEADAKVTEERLQVALEQADEAKAAKKLADEKMHDSPRTDPGDLRSSASNRMITLSVEEFDVMNKKIEQIRTEADIKVATAMAQVTSITSNETNVLMQIEESMKQSLVIQSETEDALKSAEMADAVRKVVEGELLKWRESEENDDDDDGDDDDGEPSSINEEKQ